MEYLILGIKSNMTLQVFSLLTIRMIILWKKCTFTIWKNELENGD